MTRAKAEVMIDFYYKYIRSEMRMKTSGAEECVMKNLGSREGHIRVIQVLVCQWPSLFGTGLVLSLFDFHFHFTPYN